MVVCDFCKKEIVKEKGITYGCNKVFCSKECADKYFGNNNKEW